LVKKSKAPARIVSTAASSDQKPVATMTGTSGLLAATRRERRQGRLRRRRRQKAQSA
jgi:hypothetical protein